MGSRIGRGRCRRRQIIKNSFGHKPATSFDRFEAKRIGEQKCLLVKAIGAFVIFAPCIPANRWDERRDVFGVALISVSTHPKDPVAGLVSNL